MAEKKLKLFFYSMDDTGPLYACIGLAQALLARGHQIIFLENLESPFKFPLETFGFDVIGLQGVTASLNEEKKVENTEDQSKPKSNPMQEMVEMLIKSKVFGPGSSKDKLETICDIDFIKKTIKLLIVQNPQLADAIEREQPDAIIIDHFLTPPAIMASKIPYFCVQSGNPLFSYATDKLPPPCSGYSVDSDSSMWPEFSALFQDVFIGQLNTFQASLNAKFNFVPTPEQDNSHRFFKSPYLNIYGYPEELDYHKIVERPANMVQVDTFCRDTPQPFKLPDGFVAPGEKLIYFSLGSMGCINIDLMQKVIDVLGRTPHKYIVSKGPRAAEYRPLPANCWGEAFLPQTKILPLVDLVITHGGNNTVTETFSFGKPMIVMPLMADQFDNAQRIHELGYGQRIDPFDWTEQQLVDAINRLLTDQALNDRLKTAAQRISTSNSKQRACVVIEKFLANHQASK